MSIFTRKPVENLLRAKSVAIVGASPKGAWPAGIYRNLKAAKFPGGAYLINPNYNELFGDKCYPNLAALPEVPETGVDLKVNQIAGDVVAAGSGRV